MTKTSSEAFVPTQCLFCEPGHDTLLYPARLPAMEFNGYTFSARRKRSREHYRIVRCTNCGLVRSDPILSEDRLNALYGQSEFLFSEEAPFAAETYARLTHRLLGRQIADGSISSALEIGCSTGFYLSELQGLGINDLYGFEPSQNCRAHAPKEVRDSIVTSAFDPAALGDKHFDLVTSFHVFDHLPDPRMVTRQVRDILNPGGFLLLVCHDVGALSARILGSHSPIFDIEHIYLFDQSTIARLCQNAGLRVINVDSLVNRYPLGYWLRMLPAGEAISRITPKVLSQVSISLAAGNLFILAQKEE